MEELIKLLDENLIMDRYEIIEDTIYLYVKSTRIKATCPYCNTNSNKVHSHYERSFQDLPIQGIKSKIILNNRKMFCKNPDCRRKTFAERFEFILDNSKKTLRLEDEIVNISKSVSSVAASKILKKSIAHISKSTICSLLKKSSPYT